MESIKQSVLMLMACLVLTGTYAQEATPETSKTALTAAQWQEDLRFLQKTIHTDYPFLFKKITAKEFDENVETFYKAIPQMEPHEIMVGFARMVAQFHYGHTLLGYWDWVANELRLDNERWLEH